MDSNGGYIQNLTNTFLNKNTAAENAAASFSASDVDNNFKTKSKSFKDLLLDEVDGVKSLMDKSNISFTKAEEDLIKDAKEWFDDVVEEFEEDEQSILVAVFGFLSGYEKPVVQTTLDKLLKLGKEISLESVKSKGRNAQDALNIEKASGDY